MRTGRVVAVLGAVVLLLLGVGAGVTGAAATLAHLFGRDADGYVDTPAVSLATDAAALTAERLELVTRPGDWVGWVRQLDVRIQVTPDEATDAVFVGLAPRAEVERYLSGVAHDEVIRLGAPDARYDRHEGEIALPPPGLETFWTASTQGRGTLTLDWQAEAGTWGLVVANADGSPGVAVEATAGVRTDALLPIGLVALLVALAFLGGGTVLLLVALRDDADTPSGPAGDGASPPVAAPVGEATATSGVYPVAVVGTLDPAVSRWRWLVKWFLLIPHVLVLLALWAAFGVLTLIAGVAILVTGRYPRGIFDINVGVLRWTWRVVFYGYGVLGTDRYPPFTLEETDHPAHLDVAYPEQLSRGLVLVKWWLLALPHWLIVAVLTGSVAWTADATGARWPVVGGGLIGLLVLIAAVTLAATARYPQALFDLVVGLNRWVLRVIAYAALMTDVYPPFRLDTGGAEPTPPAPPPPAPDAAGPSELRTPEVAGSAP
jgi:hypothetical protein